MASVLAAIRKAAQQGQLFPVDNRGGWSPFVREPYSGAWQNNDSWTVTSVLGYPTVFACISLIADDIAKLPPRTMKDTTIHVTTVVHDPKVDSLLMQPNAYQNHIQFKGWWITSKLIRGNTYVLKARDATGRVNGLYVLNPDLVTPLVAPDGSVYYQLGQDWLNDLPEAMVTVPASEIIHDRMNCLFHPLVGISPLFAAGLAANQGLKIQTDSAMFFENGARPSGILTAPGEISQDTADRLKAHWEAEYTGRKSGRVAVLGDGLKFEQMRMTSVDAQLIQQLNWSDQAICGVFKVPGWKVGVGQAPDRTKVENTTLDYYTSCLQILIECMELLLTTGIELKAGLNVELNLDVLFRMDGFSLVQMLAEGAKAGFVSPDEGRARAFNLPPVTGGNTPYLQQQNYSLAALARRDAQADPFASGTPKPAPTPAPAPEDEDKSFGLDGAQAAALHQMVCAVAAGNMTHATAAVLIKTSFTGISEAAVAAILATLKEAVPKDHDAPEDASTLLTLLPMFLREEMTREN